MLRKTYSLIYSGFFCTVFIIISCCNALSIEASASGQTAPPVLLSNACSAIPLDGCTLCFSPHNLNMLNTEFGFTHVLFVGPYESIN